MARFAKISGYLLLVVYLGYFTGTNFFVHSHRFQNHVVVHSHPFAAKNHGHSANEFQLISLLQEATCLSSESLSMADCPAVPSLELEARALVCWPMGSAVKTPQLRGPPSLN